MILYVDNDLDGEALLIALGQGPECLKEVIPSLSKRLKLIGAIQVLRVAVSPSTLTQFSNQPSVRIQFTHIVALKYSYFFLIQR